MQFEWNDDKAHRNRQKHGVLFQEAVAVFADPKRIDTNCSRPQDGEVRRKVVGVIEDRVFTVVYTLREGRIRLISARRPNAKEVNFYGDR